MMRAPRLVVRITMTFWLVSVANAVHANPFTFQTIPADGAISGEPGATVGWGYLLDNPSPTDWLVLTAVSSDAFQDATPNADIFDLPILAPGAQLMVPYVINLAGLYEITWDASTPAGFVNSGVFTVSAEWWSDDPLTGGQLLQLATDQSASYSATVMTPAAVPEPSTLMLLATAGLAGCWQRLRKLHRRD